MIVRYILPVFEKAQGKIPPLVWEGASLVLMALFAADFALTEEELNSLLSKIETVENEFSSRAENLYTTVAGTPSQIGAKVKGLEEEFRSRLYSAASGLNVRQKHIVKNIRSFRPGKVYRYSLHAGQKLKEALAQIRHRGR